MRGGCGLLHEVIYVNTVGITFDVILEKNNNGGDMIFLFSLNR